MGIAGIWGNGMTLKTVEIRSLMFNLSRYWRTGFSIDSRALWKETLWTFIVAFYEFFVVFIFASSLCLSVFSVPILYYIFRRIVIQWCVMVPTYKGDMNEIRYHGTVLMWCDRARLLIHDRLYRVLAWSIQILVTFLLPNNACNAM